MFWSIRVTILTWHRISVIGWMNVPVESVKINYKRSNKHQSLRAHEIIVASVTLLAPVIHELMLS